MPIPRRETTPPGARPAAGGPRLVHLQLEAARWAPTPQNPRYREEPNSSEGVRVEPEPLVLASAAGVVGGPPDDWIASIYAIRCA